MKWSQITLKQIHGLIVFTLLLLVGLWNFNIVWDTVTFIWGILFPFVLGAAIAFIINVPMSFLEKTFFGKSRKRPGRSGRNPARLLSLLLTIALTAGILILILFVLVPQLGRTILSLGDNLSAFIPQLQEWIRHFTHDNSEIMKWVGQLDFNLDKMLQWLVGFLENGAGNVMNTTVTAVGNIISGVATFFIAFSFACYILIQKEKLHVQCRKVFFAFIPRRKAEVALEVCSLIYKTFSSFLTGQCLEAIILGSMFVITMTILGMPYALLIGIVIAFTALIPVFGAFIGCALGTLMIFIVSPKQALIFVIVFLVLQQIEGNLIYPHVVGSSVGLPSIWVLAAVSVGGRLMGIIGMLIFIPISSVIYTLFREIVYLELKKHRIKRVTVNEVEEYTPAEIAKMQEIFELEHPEKMPGNQ